MMLCYVQKGTDFHMKLKSFFLTEKIPVSTDDAKYSFFSSLLVVLQTSQPANISILTMFQFQTNAINQIRPSIYLSFRSV